MKTRYKHAVPEGSFAGQLDQNLRKQAPNTFAGLEVGDDGTIQVYATVADPLLEATISTTRNATPNPPPVQVIAGRKNTRAALQQVRDAIHARYRELISQGIQIDQYSVRVDLNKVDIGVKDLTPEITAFFEHEFGADRVNVHESWGYTLLSFQRGVSAREE